MRVCGVYAITCTANGKRYVGSSIDIERRWQVHRSRLRIGNHWNEHLQNAWWKYGEPAFTFEIIERTRPAKRVTAEIYWCDKLKPAFNKTMPDIGMQTWRGTPESRAKQSRAMTGRYVRPETGAKIAEANRNRSPEVRAKLSEGNKRRLWKHTAEWKAKVSAKLKGKPKSPEARAHMAASIRQRMSTPQGKAQLKSASDAFKYSPEFAERRSLAAKKAAKTRCASPEWRAHASAAHTGKKWSAETRAKMSAWAKEHWTHCKKGHELTEENTYTAPNGWRRCRICLKAKEQARPPRDYKAEKRRRLERLTGA